MATNELSKLLGLAPPKRMGLQRPELDAAAAVDPALANDMFQGGMASEIEDRLFQAERSQDTPGLEPSPNATPSSEVTALSNLLGRYQNMRAGSPLQQQQAEYDKQRLGNLEAQNEGFNTDNTAVNALQAREIYRRREAEKVRQQPIERERMQQEGLDRRQKKQNETTLEHARIQTGPAQARADSFQGLIDEMATRGIDPNVIRSLNASSGSVGFHTPQRQFTPLNPNQAFAALQKERGYLEQAGNTDPFATFGQPNSPTQAFDQAVRTLIITSGLSGESQEELMEILSTPEDRILTMDKLVQKHDFDTTDPEFQRFAAILANIRGF